MKSNYSVFKTISNVIKWDSEEIRSLHMHTDNREYSIQLANLEDDCFPLKVQISRKNEDGNWVAIVNDYLAIFCRRSAGYMHEFFKELVKGMYDGDVIAPVICRKCKALKYY